MNFKFSNDLFNTIRETVLAIQRQGAVRGTPHERITQTTRRAFCLKASSIAGFTSAKGQLAVGLSGGAQRALPSLRITCCLHGRAAEQITM